MAHYHSIVLAQSGYPLSYKVFQTAFTLKELYRD